MAAGALPLAGCGASPSHTSPTTPVSRTATAAGPGSMRQPSLDQHRAQTAVVARLRRRGFRSLSVSCHAAGTRRFNCRVNGAQLWQAVVGPNGSVSVRLIGSE